MRHRSPSRSWGTQEALTVLVDPAWTPPLWRLAAVPAVMTTIGAKLLGRRSRRFSRMVRLACVARRLSPATDQQARRAVLAVRWLSPALPMRWACLEQSTAAALLLALMGRRAEWRHGIAVDPVRMHAWIADRAGCPVEESTAVSSYVQTWTPDGPPSDKPGIGTRPS
ncbi:lasso peptide biosynthesis B2 protein [Jiangella alba]|uniref:lasso peptide biosynthesis B2 protein n=1 Tax=Jiangella alba TaxID=561176 RepID=UPI003391EDC5